MLPNHFRLMPLTLWEFSPELMSCFIVLSDMRLWLELAVLALLEPALDDSPPFWLPAPAWPFPPLLPLLLPPPLLLPDPELVPVLLDDILSW